MKIGSFYIGDGHPPFLLAEMSGNHNQSLSRALAIVEAAANAGAHAIKLQTYTADTMTIESERSEFIVRQTGEAWEGETLYQLYEKAHTPWEWQREIIEKARSLGLAVVSSVFDETSIAFLEGIGVDAYKIASFEHTDLPLIAAAAKTGKPLIISTGMASVQAIADAMDTARKAGAREIVLLKCTSNYPASPITSNIQTIPHMKELFQCPVGLSDHTSGIGVAVGAVAVGANIIEKHLTVDRTSGGVDDFFSLEETEFASLALEASRAFAAIGTVHYGPTEREKSSLRYVRSLYVVRDIPAGATITVEDVRSIRPGAGLPPKFLDDVIGRTAKQFIPKGTPVSWEIL